MLLVMLGAASLLTARSNPAHAQSGAGSPPLRQPGNIQNPQPGGGGQPGLPGTAAGAGGANNAEPPGAAVPRRQAPPL